MGEGRVRVKIGGKVKRASQKSKEKIN